MLIPEINFEEYTEYEIDCPLTGLNTYGSEREVSHAIHLCKMNNHNPIVKKRQVLIETKTTPWEKVNDSTFG